MKELKDKLFALCVFRDLLADKVLDALFAHVKHPTVASYVEFVSLLYEANGGNLGEYVKELCQNSENVFVKTLGAQKSVPSYMRDAVEAELDVLQEVSALDRETLCAPLKYSGFLPDFTTTTLHLKEIYMHRAENVGKYGYGIYAKHRMFCVDESGCIVPVLHPDKTTLSELVDYEHERRIVIDNTKALLAGKPAANILLTGDAGTGKSSTVKAVANALWSEGLRTVEMRKDQLRLIPKVLDDLSANPLKFVLFIDDLSFLKDDDHFNALKAVLEGSVTAKSSNVVIYATSNRRHVIKERFSDRDGDDVHRNDTVQELVSLSERFGIHVTFSRPNKETFLHIVHHMAKEKGIDLPTDELDLLAERAALARGGRSARLAKQLIDGILAGS
ncbi:MAG: ATP-binding protein [Clostridia bacterium]|nr:ATP-binding protein [Clostridia bacterium]MBQ9785713.1 ATP-binding protein [Clostridia bacterium]